MPLPASGKHGRTTSEDTLALIRRLAPRYDDTTIAQIPGQPEPPHRHRAPLQESPRQGATRLPRHPRIPAAGRKCHPRPQ